jgi:hypothetical protein
MLLGGVARRQGATAETTLRCADCLERIDVNLKAAVHTTSPEKSIWIMLKLRLFVRAHAGEIAPLTSWSAATNAALS